MAWTTFVTCAAATNLQTTGRSTEEADAPGPLFHPDGPGRFRWRLGVGALLDVLPAKVVESEQRQIPMLTVNARWGLPAGFATDLRLNAIVITNQAELGASWGHRWGPLSVGGANHLGFWFGAVSVSGFDARAWGFLDRPALNLGLVSGTSHFTLSFEPILTFAQHVSLGDATAVSHRHVSLAGYLTSLLVENEVGTRGIVYFGLGATYARPDYQAWLAFSDLRARLWYPRILGGYCF